MNPALLVFALLTLVGLVWLLIRAEQRETDTVIEHLEDVLLKRKRGF